jgi:hypothetical protein
LHLKTIDADKVQDRSPPNAFGLKTDNVFGMHRGGHGFGGGPVKFG